MVEWLLVHGSLIALFLLANSFFVAAEFAMVSVRETRIDQLIAAGRPEAVTVRKLKQNIDEFLPAVQFGVTLASLALGGIGEPSLAAAFMSALGRVRGLHVVGGHAWIYAHGAAVVVAFALITYFEVLLGELVPKSLSLQRAERIALAVAGPVDVFMRMTRPFVRVMNGSAAVVLRLFRAPLRGETGTFSPEELKLMASAMRRTGQLPGLQEEMVHRALELGEVTASQIMTPRARIVSLAADTPLEVASARIIEEQHSRVPVYESLGGGQEGRNGGGGRSGPGGARVAGRGAGRGAEYGGEHIIGVVYAKDIARLMHFRSMSMGLGSRGQAPVTLRQVMHEVLLIPETKPVLELLEEFQERRRQIAIVVDEFGSTVGLVTAEDVLEQLVGEMEDEHDIERTEPLATSDGGLLLEGSASLRDLQTQLRWRLPRETGVETLAGMVLARLGHLPAVGESVVAEGRRFTVVAMEGRRIARIRANVEGGKAGANVESVELRPALK